MKYYLVARTTCAMVGIEQCRGFIVSRSLRAAFEKEYAGRILFVTAGALAWPGISYVAYKKASGPFYMFVQSPCKKKDPPQRLRTTGAVFKGSGVKTGLLLFYGRLAHSTGYSACYCQVTSYLYNDRRQHYRRR